MSRRLNVASALIIAAASLAAGEAYAQPAPAAPDPLFAPVPTGTPSPAPAGDAPSPPAAAPSPPPPPPTNIESAQVSTLGEQAISAEAGLATAGRVTPGGLRIIGHYLYQLSDEDWFDGAAGFTFGSGTPACFRDRQDAVICEHGISDGTGVEISARIRRLFEPHGIFQALAQAGVGIGLVRFSNDNLSGVAIPFHFGGGVRVLVSSQVTLIVEDELALGFGGFGRGLGLQPQLDFAITAGAEFRLR